MVADTPSGCWNLEPPRAYLAWLELSSLHVKSTPQNSIIVDSLDSSPSLPSSAMAGARCSEIHTVNTYLGRSLGKYGAFWLRRWCIGAAAARFWLLEFG